MEILNNINEKEIIDITAKCKGAKHVKNILLGNIVYIILWIAFNIFFIYLMTKESILTKFWFVSLPIGGFNIIRLWAFISKLVKDLNEMKNTGYVLTDKALYYYKDDKYKELKRIDFKDIVAVEKSDYICDGFYVATLLSTIHVKNVQEEKELFESLVHLVQQ